MTAGLHRRMLTLDAHLDAPVHLGRSGWSIGERHELATDVAQLDLPRMEDGNLSGGFFVTYTEQGPLSEEGYAVARAAATVRSDQIEGMLAEFPDRIGQALTPDDARRLHAEGLRVAFRSIENSYFMGEDLAVLDEFRRRGVRMAGPVHNHANQFADSATDLPRWHGLSPLGREWVDEMNRLGLLIDASHASDAAFDQMLERSRAPLVLSHSGSRTVHDCPRNIDDTRLRALASSGGVIGFATIFLSAMDAGPERLELFRRHGRIYHLQPQEQVELAARWSALDAAEPMWAATFDSYIAGLLHVIEVAGVDHVCFGADWDGGGGFPGMDDITVLPTVTERLAAEGLSEDDLAKLWSGNLLRVLDDAQTAAR